MNNEAALVYDSPMEKFSPILYLKDVLEGKRSFLNHIRLREKEP